MSSQIIKYYTVSESAYVWKLNLMDRHKLIYMQNKCRIYLASFSPLDHHSHSIFFPTFNCGRIDNQTVEMITAGIKYVSELLQVKRGFEMVPKTSNSK